MKNTDIDYKQKFDNLFNTSDPIFSKDKDIFILQAGEVFEQCWADTKTRETFPEYWFVSNKGNLISVYEKEARWIKPYKHGAAGRGCYKYYIYEGNKRKLKSIEVHNLVGLVHGADDYGLARHMLDKDGIYAIGVKSNIELHVQGHHKDGDCSNHSVDNIRHLTTDIHDILNKVPAPDAGAEEQIRFMQELGAVAAREVPDALSIVTTGQKVNEDGRWTDDGFRDIAVLGQIFLTENALSELRNMMV